MIWDTALTLSLPTVTKAVHRFLFSDLYEWADEVRSVNISKKGTQFTLAENIERQAELVFKRLKGCNYFKGLPHSEFAEDIVDFYCVTNALHSFREGNGRTQHTETAGQSHKRMTGGFSV